MFECAFSVRCGLTGLARFDKYSPEFKSADSAALRI